ncbi:MAG: carboxypeptidase-like regulatory domain-containing protein, partial [Ferruginibacter sp.]|nr:carboxypeptidase-like regulatory domain-containing protein [Ferruginibacter sp.]
MLTSIFAFAQDRLVTGKVVDDKGNGVPAASIKIAGTNKGTSTDSDGSFAIKVKKGEQLVISSTGYESKTVPTDGQSFVGVTIATTSATMQEVVVTTATGQIRQKSSVG